MSFNQQYLDVAQKACDAERRFDWERAAFFWNLAVDQAIGRNRHWAIARYEYCRYHSTIRGSLVISKVFYNTNG